MVAEIIDKYAPLALGFRKGGGELGRLRLSDRNGQSTREVLYLRPFSFGRERRDHMHPLAARQHRKGLQSDGLQDIAKAEGGETDGFEIQPHVGIKVEHQAIGLFDIFAASAPAVELDRAHLDAG
ncbi:hypothetical protein D3C80_1656620 [compost metagenome]